MADFHGRRIGKTKYINVSEWRDPRDQTYYKAVKRINGKFYCVANVSLEACAKQLDIKLIESGLKPINILKKK